MNHFEIRDQFYLDGEETKILSGAIHYFRIHPKDWYHSLYNLKATGLNAVETYVPWNLHEPKEGTFDFKGLLDIVRFIELAESLDLMVIVRPSPYICAELEFGGLPAWLLEKDCHIRTSDPKFIHYVDQYYERLLKKLTPLLITNGGPIVMMQIENEYGSYGEDKDYLKAVKELMLKYKIDVPLFTSDGTWEAALESGSLIKEGILPTGNFGSDGKANFKNLKYFHDKYEKDYPLMSMEFWDGWFNNWGKEIVTRNTKDLVKALRETVQDGSFNLYMFHGGTNFGFTTGTSEGDEYDLPQITSYDYGAPLDEQGNPTKAYYEIKTMLKEELPELEQFKPIIKESMVHKEIPLAEKVSLRNVLEEVSEIEKSLYPKTSEELEHYYGYTLYRTKLDNYGGNHLLKIVDANDRCQIFVDNEHLATQYQHEIGEDIPVEDPKENSELSILLENVGRINYGHKLLADTQRKGIRTGVMFNHRFINHWTQYKIDFSKVKDIDFNKKWEEGKPSFYKYNFKLEEKEDTYIDLSQFGKGIVLVNGFNIGRYWDIGPTLSLYVPKHLLNEGKNSIVIFETEGKYSETLDLLDQAKFKEMEKEA
ncbi:MAG: beta-galactosidase [Atopostipes sp.]|nr:beta-galactosidase [Atopostipes sp.]